MKTKVTPTVKEIHAAFDRAADDNAKEAYAFFVYLKGKGSDQSDRLSTMMAEKAKIREEAEIDKFLIAKKAKQLQALGFTSTPEVAMLEQLEAEAKEIFKGIGLRIRKVEDAYDAALKKDEKVRYELALHYKETYPLLKFIREDQLDAVCKKYGLVYAPVSRYTGNVPRASIDEITERDNIREEDFTELLYDVHLYSDFGNHKEYANLTFSEKEFLTMTRDYYWDCHLAKEMGFKNPHWAKNNVTVHGEEKRGLFIAADESMFTGLNKLNKNKFGFFSKVKAAQFVPDPVVFRFVRGGVLIIAKWGPEADDEMLTLS
jgi:hypothetical protein